MKIWFGMVAFLTLAGCGAAVSDARMVMRPSKPADCPLEFVEVSAADMAPGAKFGAGGEYEMLGMVTVGADKGTNAMSEEMKKLVRPHACDMGGDAVSLVVSGVGANGFGAAQQNIAFSVWGKRPTAPAAPQKF